MLSGRALVIIALGIAADLASRGFDTEVVIPLDKGEGIRSHGSYLLSSG